MIQCVLAKSCTSAYTFPQKGQHQKNIGPRPEKREIAMEQTAEKRKLHYAWVIAAVGFIFYWFTICIISNCVGMFVTPVSGGLGISRSQFSLTTTFTSVGSMVMSYLSGRLFKRYSIRRVLLVLSITTPLAYGCYSIAPNIYCFYIIGFICGMGMTGMATVGVSALISNWFNEKRGTAIAIAATGSGVGGVFLNPFIAKLITELGWRQTYFILAVMMALTLIPCALLLVRDRPADRGLEPYGGAIQAGTDVQSSGLTLAQARKSPSFWMLVPVCAITSGTCVCIMQHTTAYATDLGNSYTAAAMVASMVTASLAAGKLIMGVVFDKIGSRRACTFSLSVFLVGLVLYSLAEVHMTLLYVAAAIFGLGLSFATVAYSVVVQDLFGKKDFPAIYGSLIVFASLGSALGSPIIAAVYDALGSYRLAWLGLAALMATNLVLINLAFAKKEQAPVS